MTLAVEAAEEKNVEKVGLVLAGESPCNRVGIVY